MMGPFAFFCLFFLFSSSWGQTQTQTQTQTQKRKGGLRSITLSEAIEQGLRKNYGQQARLLQASLLSDVWKDKRAAFFWPEVSLSLQTDPQRLGRLHSGGREGHPFSRRPRGALGLEIEDYTLFNWGKDTLAYLNEKQTYSRELEKLEEDRRDLRHQLILRFFDVTRLKREEKIKRDQLRHAAFVYRLIREKVLHKKATTQDYYQSRGEYLRAQTELHRVRNRINLAHEALALVLADPMGTHYSIRQELRYQTLKMPLREGQELGRKHGPIILDMETALQNARRAREITSKELFPLPKFFLSLGAYRYVFGHDTTGTSFESSLGPGHSSLDLVATLNATWTLFGKGGFFNARKVKSSETYHGLTIKRLAQAKHGMDSQIHRSYEMIHSLEQQIKILESHASNTQKSLERVRDNYIEGRTGFAPFKQALVDMAQTGALLEEMRFQHLEEKVNLAKFIGVDDFPGESFDHLAVEVKVEKEGDE